MSGFSDICICQISAGISKFWYVDAKYVTSSPDESSNLMTTTDLATSVALQPIVIEENTGEYSETEALGEQGTYFDLEVNISNMGIDAVKDAVTLALSGRRLLVMFKDNNGKYRFIMNARKKQKANTETFTSGKNHYQMSFGRRARTAARYFTGTVTVASDGSITLS